MKAIKDDNFLQLQSSHTNAQKCAIFCTTSFFWQFFIKIPLIDNKNFIDIFKSYH